MILITFLVEEVQFSLNLFDFLFSSIELSIKLLIEFAPISINIIIRFSLITSIVSLLFSLFLLFFVISSVSSLFLLFLLHWSNYLLLWFNLWFNLFWNNNNCFIFHWLNIIPCIVKISRTVNILLFIFMTLIIFTIFLTFILWLLWLS